MDCNCSLQHTTKVWRSGRCMRCWAVQYLFMAYRVLEALSKSYRFFSSFWAPFEIGAIAEQISINILRFPLWYTSITSDAVALNTWLFHHTHLLFITCITTYIIYLTLFFNTAKRHRNTKILQFDTTSEASWPVTYIQISFQSGHTP